jgi:hypothetical protein
MRRRRVAAGRETARFGSRNTESVAETAPIVVLDTKSPPMTAFMTSSSELL